MNYEIILGGIYSLFRFQKTQFQLEIDDVSRKFDSPYFVLGSVSDHGLSRKFIHHDIICLRIYNVKSFEKAEHYLEIDDVINVPLTTRISSYVRF